MPSKHQLAADVARLLRQKLGVHPIAQKLGIGAQTVRNIRRAMGLPANRPGGPRLWNPEAMAAAVERYRQGGISLVACEKQHELPRNAMRDYLARARMAGNSTVRQETPQVERPAVKRLPGDLCEHCHCVRDQWVPCGCVGGWR